ncbi:sigma 54-interacting transcriptional regulator [Bacillus sp. JJ1532]|uniref:sigma-54 interaction domain-containing protein n=1 Tax=Bacillus sp. JJ1532 TaxID=3122958 RepID=UPI003000294D
MKKEDVPLEKDHLFQLLHTLTDPIFISDSSGTCLWLNHASAAVCHRDRSELVGKSVRDLEAEGVFFPSVTKLALESGQTVTTVQEMSNGRKYVVTGSLLKDQKGQIEYVIAHSRDITEAIKTSIQLEETEALLRRYSDQIRKMSVVHSDQFEEQPLIGDSIHHKNLTNKINKVSSVDTTALIIGETGVGKNVVVQQIHAQSNRHNKPLIHINCAAMPESLIESELFGYVKGAFTGANSSGKPGLVKLADQGTLFLDEIGELPLHLQAKLLQLLQDKTYLPVGSSQVVNANIRIIAATNCNLEEMIKAGKFRSDLYYRLNILSIFIPPLRERREDFIPLLSYYLKKFNNKYQKQKKLKQEVIKAMLQYDWPGNIRELENIVERLVVMSNEDLISLSDLTLHLKQADGHYFFPFSKVDSLPQTLEKVEKEIILESLQKHKTTRKTAKALGLTQSSLVRRIQKFNLYSHIE